MNISLTAQDADIFLKNSNTTVPTDDINLVLQKTVDHENPPGCHQTNKKPLKIFILV